MVRRADLGGGGAVDPLEEAVLDDAAELLAFGRGEVLDEATEDLFGILDRFGGLLLLDVGRERAFEVGRLFAEDALLVQARDDDADVTEGGSYLRQFLEEDDGLLREGAVADGDSTRLAKVEGRFVDQDEGLVGAEEVAKGCFARGDLGLVRVLDESVARPAAQSQRDLAPEGARLVLPLDDGKVGADYCGYVNGLEGEAAGDLRRRDLAAVLREVVERDERVCLAAAQARLELHDGRASALLRESREDLMDSGLEALRRVRVLEETLRGLIHIRSIALHNLAQARGVEVQGGNALQDIFARLANFANGGDFHGRTASTRRLANEPDLDSFEAGCDGLRQALEYLTERGRG